MVPSTLPSGELIDQHALINQPLIDTQLTQDSEYNDDAGVASDTAEQSKQAGIDVADINESLIPLQILNLEHDDDE